MLCFGSTTIGSRSTTEPKALESGALGGLLVSSRIFFTPKVDQDLHADAVVAAVRREAQRLVRLDRVHALVLEGVGAQLVVQSDARAPPGACTGSRPRPSWPIRFSASCSLLAAIAALRSKDVASDALVVDAHEHRLVCR